MHVQPISDDSLDSPALLTRSPEKHRRAGLRSYLDIIAATIRRIFAHKKNEDTEHDIALGDQVKLPEEFLEAVSRIHNSQDRKK